MKHYLIGAELQSQVAHDEPLEKMVGQEANKVAFDRFTILHALSGAALRLLGVGFWWTSAIAVGWELVEPMLKDKFPTMFPHPQEDSTKNKVVDALSVMGGWYGTGLVLQARAEKEEL